MPASTLDPVSAAIRTSLTQQQQQSDAEKNGLDGQLAGSTKKALLSNIEFEPAGSYQTNVLDKLKSKYIVLKAADQPGKASKAEENMGAEEGLKPPKRELYPLESVQLGWKNCDWTVGTGLVNMGNTCYLNSTLQALFHVPALVNWLMSDKEHSTECQDSGTLCIICAMRKTLQSSQQRTPQAIRPLLIYNKLRIVCRNFIPGRQEDAHEFLRYLVEAMEKAYLSRFKNSGEFDSRTKETTPLNQILGGYLRSAVCCLRCNHVSTTFQHFQDLLLDVRKAQTLEEALEGYFSREKLDDESYQCESCQKKVPATKQFTLERAPMVLCIQLKRFSVTNNKITKHVSFRSRLDLTKYTRHHRLPAPLIYRFVALVTHMGPTVSCGHYTAVAQAPSGNFYQFDDSMVRPISNQAVFGTNAYIMLYELEPSSFIPKGMSPAAAAAATARKSDSTGSAASAASKSTASSASGTSSTTSSGNSLQKMSLNGVGYTSDKAYGPELPPNRQGKTGGRPSANGMVSSSLANGNGTAHSSSNSDSDSEDGGSPVKVRNGGGSSQNGLHSEKENGSRVSSTPATPRKEADSSSSKPLTPNNRSNVSESANVSTSSTASADSGSRRNVTANGVGRQGAGGSGMKSLVPYEADDTSSSEEANEREEGESSDKESKVVTTTTNSGVGEWQVTSSTDTPLPDGKRWNSRETPSSSDSPSNGGAGAGSANGNGVVNELFRMSHNGYSAPVATWNGTRSNLDKEVNNERREDRKRTLAADSSEDQGRVKHPKMSSSFKSNPGYNPIQEYHNGKNWGQNNNGSGGHYSGKQFHNNRHRRNFHHNKNNYHKSHRFRQ